MLSQESINLVFSNLNSYPRESLDGKTPYDNFITEHGEEGRKFLEELGITRIPAAQVTLHPFLLGQNFQRAADKAILKKNGVTDKKNNSVEKSKCPLSRATDNPLSDVANRKFLSGHG